MPPAYGYEEFFEIGFPESTYGTPVAVTRAFRPLTFTLTPNDIPQPMTAPTGVPVDFRHDPTRPREWKPHLDLRGTIEVHLDQTDAPLFIMLAMAGLSSHYVKTGPTDTTVYNHEVLVPTVPVNTPAGFSIIHHNGQEDVTYGGVMIDVLRVIASGDDLIKLSMDVIAQTFTRGNVAASASIATTPLLSMYESQFRLDTAGPGQTTGAGDNLGNIQSWEFRIENNLRAIPASGVGARAIKKPDYQGYRQFMLDFQTDWENDTYQDLVHQLQAPNSYVTAEMLLTSGELVAGAAATFYNHRFRFPAAKQIGPPPQYGGGDGIIPQSVSFKAGSWSNGGTDEIAEYFVENAQSADYIS